MNPYSEALRRALAEAAEKTLPQLGKETLDGMALPSYLHGNALSRYVFWRKLVSVLRAAQLRPNTRVLDFGCGFGVLLPRLQEAGRTVLATDLHLEPARCVALSLGLTGVQFVPADVWECTVPDAGLDTVIAANVLEHIDDRRPLLATLGRKLAQDGRLVVSGPTENSLYRFGRRLVGFSGHYHVATVRDVLADIRTAGYQLVYHESWPLPGPFCLYQIAAFTRP